MFLSVKVGFTLEMSGKKLLEPNFFAILFAADYEFPRNTTIKA